MPKPAPAADSINIKEGREITQKEDPEVKEHRKKGNKVVYLTFPIFGFLIYKMTVAHFLFRSEAEKLNINVRPLNDIALFLLSGFIHTVKYLLILTIKFFIVFIIVFNFNFLGYKFSL